MPTLSTAPNDSAQLASRAYPRVVAGNDPVPSSRPAWTEHSGHMHIGMGIDANGHDHLAAHTDSFPIGITSGQLAAATNSTRMRDEPRLLIRSPRHAHRAQQRRPQTDQTTNPIQGTQPVRTRVRPASRGHPLQNPRKDYSVAGPGRSAG